MIVHKDCSVSSLFLPCTFLFPFPIKNPLLFKIQNGKALSHSVFIIMCLASPGFVVPRNKCPLCLWVGSPCSSPGRPAQKPFLGRWSHACPQRHTVRVSEIEKGWPFIFCERKRTGCFLPLSLGQNCSLLLGTLWGTLTESYTCVPSPACRQRGA